MLFRMCIIECVVVLYLLFFGGGGGGKDAFSLLFYFLNNLFLKMIMEILLSFFLHKIYNENTK